MDTEETGIDQLKVETSIRMILSALERIKEEMPDQSHIHSEVFKIDRLAMVLIEKSRSAT